VERRENDYGEQEETSELVDDQEGHVTSKAYCYNTSIYLSTSCLEHRMCQSRPCEPQDRAIADIQYFVCPKYPYSRELAPTTTAHFNHLLLAISPEIQFL